MVNVMKIGIFAAALLALMWFVAPMLGVAGTANVVGFSVSMALLLGLATLFTVDYFGWFKVIPVPIPRQMALIAMILLWAGTAFYAGWLPSNLSLGSVSQVPGASVASCVASVSPEIKGLSATINLNAYDKESNTPYSAAVSVPGCYAYVNGGKTAISASDTTAGAITGFKVGDTVDIFCANETYYTDDIVGHCIAGQQESVDIDAYSVATEANMAVTIYDSTEATALTAVTNTDSGDYTMALGAGGETPIYVKLEVNAANKGYAFGGWVVARWANISKVEPAGTAASYSKIAAPDHLKSVAIVINTTSSDTSTKDYDLFKANSPVILHEWDYIKEKFIVTADSTYDPNGGYGTAAKLNGFTILAKDAGNARADDGSVIRDVYAHTSSGADAGLDETDTSPQGKLVGALIVVS